MNIRFGWTIALLASLVLSIPLAAQESGPPTQEPPKQEKKAKPPKQEESKPSKTEKEAKAPKAEKEAKPPKQEKEAKPPKAEKEKKPPKTEKGQKSAAAQQGKARPTGKSAHIPDPQFKAHFGKQHTFGVNRVVTTTTIVPNQTQFVYSGYTFIFLDPWPEVWLFTDDCYIDYVGDEYFLFDVFHPGIRVALFVVG